MQQLTEQIIRLSPPGGLFDHTVIGNLFADASPGARKQLIHRATRAGETLRLKRGLFILDKVFRKSELHPFALAAVLYARSHIRNQFGTTVIPEAVYQISSVHCAESNRFSPPRRFSFDRVPSLPNPRTAIEEHLYSKVEIGRLLPRRCAPLPTPYTSIEKLAGSEMA